MDLYDNRPVERMWFGTEEKMGWIETPQTGADVSSVGQSANATLQNGGGTVRNSWDSHKVYQFSWGTTAPPSMVSLLQSYRNGSYGRGLLYFHDPMYYTTNLLPKRWADPSMAVNWEAEPLIPDVNPTAVPVVSTSNNYPVTAARYPLPASYSSQTNSTELFFPIPPGMVFTFGAVYSGPGQVYLRTPAQTITVSGMSLTDGNVVNAVVRDQPWVRIGIRNPGATASEITITAMTARLLSTLSSSEAMPFSYSNQFINPSFETSTVPVEIRRNLLQFTNTTSTTGWTPTSGVSSVEGGRIKLVQNTASPTRLGFIHNLAAPVAAGAYVASFRGQTNGDASLTGARAYLYDSATSTLRASQNISVASGADGEEYRFTMTATGVFNQVYLEYFNNSGIAVGATAYFTEPLLEAGAVHRGFFNGSQPTRVRRNLSLNPRAVASGAASWFSNNGTGLPVSRVTSFPVAHPLGITTGCVVQSLLAGNPVLASLYDIDGLSNTGTPRRSMGVWVLVTEPGYRMGNVEWATGEELPANQWVYVKSVQPRAAGQYATLSVQAITGNASSTVRVYFTGSQVEYGAGPVGDYIDGTLAARAGFANAWSGAANNSESYTYDTDFSYQWVGATGSTASTMTGMTVAGLSAVGCFAIRSTRWKASGQYSLRLIASTANNVSYAVITAAGSTALRGTVIAMRYQEEPITGSTWTAGLGRLYWNPVPQVFSNMAPNGPGTTELRAYSAATPGLSSTVIVAHGGTVGTADVWFDDMGIFLNNLDPSDPYMGSYFDGSSPGASWNGTPNNSASTWSGVTPLVNEFAAGPWHAGEGHSGCRFQGNPTVINYNGVYGGQIGLSANFQEAGAWE